MDISNVFVSSKYLGIYELILFICKLQKKYFYHNLMTTDYSETIHLVPERLH